MTPTDVIIIVSVICPLIVILLFLICCLSCVFLFLFKRELTPTPPSSVTLTLSLCAVISPSLPAGEQGAKSKEPRVARWADTAQGNVELLKMKTLSETRLEGGPSVTGTVEEGKKESIDSGGKEELGVLTADTFGFQGEVVKNKEKSCQVIKCHIHNSNECCHSDLTILYLYAAYFQ